MNKPNQNQTKILLKSIFVIVAFALSIKAVAIWAPPTGGPTGNQTPPPVNVGTAVQQKTGGLVVGGFRTTGPGIADSTFDIDGLVTLNGGLKITSGAPGLNKILSSDADGDVAWSTLAAVGGLTNPMTEIGDIIYGGAGGVPTRLDSTAGTNGFFLQSNGAAAPTWEAVTSGAPVNATYITQTANATLTNEQALSLLGTGLVKNTTSTGVLSIAIAGTDYLASMPNLTGDVTSTGTTTSYSATVPFGKGGTGVTAAADDTMLVSNNTAWQVKTIPNCTDTAGNHLNYATATNTFTCGTSNSGGGGGIGGSGTNNYISKWTPDGATLGNSSIFDNGNVGIGTTTPNSKFSIVNTSTSENMEIRAAGDSFIDLISTVGSGRAWTLLSSGTSGLGIGKFSIFDGTSGVSRLTIGTSGLVGIGNTAPTELLTLGANSGQLGSMSMFGNTSGKIIIRPAAAAGTYTLVLPTTDGNANDFLQSDGSGNLTWAPASAGNLTGDVTSSGLATTYNNTVPLAKGGTGLTSIAARTIWVANSANTLTPLTPGANQSIRINAGNTAWEVYTPSSGGAPTDATYITQTANGTLTNEQALSTLATGILKNTTSTGVLSIATAGDFPILNQNTTGTAGSLSANGANCPAGQYPLGVNASGAVESCTADATGGVSDGDKGDITVTASGATWNLDAAVVGTAELANDAVTYAKLQNVGANTFLANATATSADVQEIATNRIPLFASAITGTPSSTTFLRGDGQWIAAGAADNLGNHIASQNLDMATFKIYGGHQSGNDLYLETTSHATKGDVIIANEGGNVGVGTATPTNRLHVVKNSASESVVKVVSDYNFSPVSAVNTVDVSLTGLTGTTGMTAASFSNALDADATDTIYGAKFNAAGVTVQDSIAGYFTASGGTNNYAIIVPGGSGRVGIGTTAPGELLSLGTAGTTLGVLSLAGNTSGKIIIQPAAAAGTYTLTLPTTDGNANEFLQTNGSGVLTWAAAGGGAPALHTITAATATNTINSTNFVQEWQWNTLGTGTGFKLSSNSTVAPGTTQKLFEIALSGTGAGGSISTAAYIANTKTNSGGTNVSGDFRASGGTTNNIGIRLTANTGAQLEPYGASAGNTSEIRFLELAANGTNYTAFKSGDAMAGNLTYTLPTTAPTAGQVLSSTAAGVLSWATDSSGGTPRLDQILAATAANT